MCQDHRKVKKYDPDILKIFDKRTLLAVSVSFLLECHTWVRPIVRVKKELRGVERRSCSKIKSSTLLASLTTLADTSENPTF
jgi:hypothetical protein